MSLRLTDVTTRLTERRITLDVDQDAKEWLADHGFSNQYGKSPSFCSRCGVRLNQCIRCSRYCPDCTNKHLESSRSKIIIRHNSVSPQRQLHSVPRLIHRCATLLLSDGDMVPIRVSPDGSGLIVTDLHEPDSAKSVTPIDPTHESSTPEDHHY